VGQIVFASNGVTRMTTSKQYDYLNRLASISSTPSNAFNCLYNAASQRVMDRLADGSYWHYGYDSLGQVTSGNKFWVDETSVAGQQFGYAFDTIGNRTQTEAGGDQNGLNLRVAGYTNNLLNQIISRGVPPYVDVMGNGLATNGVTVGGLAAYRKGEYFREQLSVNNSSAAQWTNITVAAPGQGSVSGHVYVPKTPEAYACDADGNLLSDGRWNYTWDGENRLVGMASLSGAPSGSQLQLAFAYDYQGRRIQKSVSTNTGGGSFSVYTNVFACDGWNCLAVLNPSLLLSNSFLWGVDLSGSQQGAGGVGGLVESSYYGPTTTNCFVSYDGNGNVSALVNAANGSTVANYEYGPFGEVIRATGPMAKVNPFRFSTKYDDDESDFLYYGYRYYNPSTGRWLSRDPLEEPGFIRITKNRRALTVRREQANAYLFVANDSLSIVDYLGLNPSIPPGTTFTVDLQGGGTVTVTVGAHFNAAEQTTARRALCLARKLLGYAPYLPPFSDTYWATFSGLPIDGLTTDKEPPGSTDKSIFISSSMKPTCAFNSVAFFGAVLAHEADHYYTGSDDGPGGPGDRINTPILNAVAKVLADAVCGCCNGKWQLENMLGKYACDCGLTPCKPKPCPPPK
jgi:RHS repeat-associated protein